MDEAQAAGGRQGDATPLPQSSEAAPTSTESVQAAMVGVRDLARRLKSVASAAPQPGATVAMVDHGAWAKEALALLADLGAAMEHEKATHNLADATAQEGGKRKPRRGEEEEVAERPPPWHLSLQDDFAVRQVMQIAVWWGVLPCLAEGVGVPLSERLQKASSTAGLVPNKVVDEDRLLDTTKALVEIASRTAELKAHLLPTYLPDMLAALLQLAYGPTSSAAANAVSAPPKVTSSKATPSSILTQFIPSQEKPSGDDQSEQLTSAQKWARAILESKLINSMPPQTLMSALFLLMGGPGRAAPRWLSSQCGYLLSRTLMRTGGVAGLLTHLGSAGGDVSDALHARIVHIVTTPPKQVPTAKYYAAVCPQLRELMHVPLTNDNAEGFRRIAVEIAGRMLEKQPNLAKRYFLAPIIEPLSIFVRSGTIAEESASPSIVILGKAKDDLDDEVVDETKLKSALEDLDQVLSAHSVNASLTSAVSEVTPALFQLYCYTRRSPTALKATLTSIIDTFFLVSLSSSTAATLKGLVIPSENEEQPFASAYSMAFGPGPSGGIVIRRLTKPRSRDFNWEAECMVQLLKDLGNEQLTGNLFVDLMQTFVAVRRHDVHKEVMETQQSQEAEHQRERYLMLLHLLASMSENFGEKLIQDVVQVATLLRVMFEGGDEVVVSLCLGILSALLSGKIKLNQAEAILLLDLLPFLAELKDHPEEHISTLAAELHIRIITRDQSWFSNADKSDTPALFRKDVEQILAELRDPLLPVRAQALVALRKLVLSKDDFARSNKDKILDIFQTQLRDSDSYLYFAAMQGLGALGDIFPEEIIPVLVSSFLDDSLIEDTRLKLGETLVRVCERCGETLPKYGHHFVNTFLKGARSTIANLRASSLSNLGSVCELMRFALHPFIHDIVDTLAELLRKDPEPQVRLGCLFVLSRLMASLGVESLELLADRLREIYRLLRYTSESDADVGVRERAREVVALMNAVTRLVFEQQTQSPMREDHPLHIIKP